MIDGVIINPSKQISDERGRVMHMLREDFERFVGFCAIWFSCVYA
jgi:dTDP-4-dehydrorhamnose 3,5-epimerase